MNTIEKMNDKISVMITVAGIERMNSPRIPPTKSIGENTTTVVSVPANDADPTRSSAVRTAPSRRPSSCGLGSSRLESIDSEITIASSTRSPRVKMRPNRVIVLRE